MRPCTLLLGLAALTFCQPASTTYDVLIRNGVVIDGTGAPRKRADLAITGDTIAAIGNLQTATANIVVDAGNRAVAPGFIDLLGNSQSAVLIDPRLEGKIRQGVTTEVTGEGHSPGPIDEAMAAEMERTKPPGWPAVTWRTLGEFMRVVEKQGTALNFAFYIGAANPREMVLGHADRAPAPDELRRMEAIVDQAMREGAVGLASALIYPPGRFATTEELTALARRAGSYWTHLRSESDNIEAAIDEALRIGRDANVPVNIFHLKIGGQKNWGRMASVIRRIEAAQKNGLDVAANIYPYTATSTDLTSIVPAWALEGGYAQFLARLSDPTARGRIAEALRAGRLRDSGASTILIRGIGKRLDAIAREMKTDSAEAALRLFERETSSSPVAVFFSLSEDDMKLALRQPWVAFGSDSGAVVVRNKGAHPRAYGTFARVLGTYVREQKLLTLEEAVRKMTSLAASRAFLSDRGRLAVGMKADVVVFDPEKVRDVSTYEDPHHFAEGVSDVIVNGKFAIRDGKLTGELPGRVLRRSTVLLPAARGEGGRATVSHGPMRRRSPPPEPGDEVDERRFPADLTDAQIDLAAVIRRMGWKLQEGLTERGVVNRAKSLREMLGPGEILAFRESAVERADEGREIAVQCVRERRDRLLIRECLFPTVEPAPHGQKRLLGEMNVLHLGVDDFVGWK
jgi:N-acyl-D-amino-acid deacylase